MLSIIRKNIPRVRRYRLWWSLLRGVGEDSDGLDNESEVVLSVVRRQRLKRDDRDNREKDDSESDDEIGEHFSFLSEGVSL